MSTLTSDLSPAVHTPNWISKGTKTYRQVEIALFLAGFASFSLIYCVQPLLPAFAHSFQLSPGASSLALSLTTGFLAMSILMTGALSQSLSRKSLMFTSMALAGVLNLIAALVPNWNAFLIARALEGLVLGGVPAIAMAYLAEEIEPEHLGKTMGLYIAGTGFGAMIGRVGMGFVTEFVSWQVALAMLATACLLATAGFGWLLPPSRNFTPQPRKPLSFHLQAWQQHLRNPAMVRIYALGFVLTSVFVTIFNYVAFRLSSAPYHLSQTQLSTIFLTYAIGMVASSYSGNLSLRLGKRLTLALSFITTLLGVVATLCTGLPMIIVGISLITIGFFLGHSVASSSIGPLAGKTKSHASSLYLMFYYMGSSITGTVSGWLWQHQGWNAVASLTIIVASIGLLLAWTGKSSFGTVKPAGSKAQ